MPGSAPGRGPHEVHRLHCERPTRRRPSRLTPRVGFQRAAESLVVSLVPGTAPPERARRPPPSDAPSDGRRRGTPPSMRLSVTALGRRTIQEPGAWAVQAAAHACGFRHRTHRREPSECEVATGGGDLSQSARWGRGRWDCLPTRSALDEQTGAGGLERLWHHDDVAPSAGPIAEVEVVTVVNHGESERR